MKLNLTFILITLLCFDSYSQKVNLGAGVNFGYRSPYDNVGFTGMIQLFSDADVYGNISNKSWALGLKYSLTQWKFQPVVGFTYCFRFKDVMDFGDYPNYTYYQADPIRFYTPEIGVKRRLYMDEETKRFVEVTACINYRISGQTSSVLYVSGPPIEQKYIDQLNFEVGDGIGINVSLIYFFF